MTDVHYAAVQPLSNGDDQEYCGKMHIRVLGPVEVVSDGVDVRLGGPKQRTILALLVAEVGKVVSVDALIDAARTLVVLEGIANADNVGGIMDAQGIWAQIVYPNTVGFGGQKFIPDVLAKVVSSGAKGKGKKALAGASV